MRSKFQLSEGEVQRILSLHQKAILKERQNVLNEGFELSLIKADGSNFGIAPKKWYLKTFKVLKNDDNIIYAKGVDTDDSEFGNLQVNCGDPEKLTIKGEGPGTISAQVDGTTYRNDKKLTDLIKKSCSGQSGTKKNLTYSLKFNRTFTSKKNKDKTVKLKAGTILTFKPEKGGATFKFGNKFGWFSCSTTNISFGDKTNRRIYSANNEEFTKTLKGVCKQMGVTMPDKGDGKNNSLTSDGNNNYSGTDGQNTQTQDPNEVLKSGFSDGNSTDRSLLFSCDNAEFAAKSCNDRSLRAQITINDNCEPQVLNDAIRNFEKGTVGVKDADMRLLEDGVWGEASKAAWEACKTNMRQGTSGSSGQSGSNGSAGSAGSAGTNGSSGSVGVQGGEDLKLTDAEYVKLTS